MLWLTRDMVEVFHGESLDEFGGADGIRDEGLLLGAIARPENIHAYEPSADFFQLAAAYGVCVVKNHPFIDGNKRTGALCAISFLALNGVEVAFDEPEIAAIVIGVAASEVSEDEFAEWLRRGQV
jgi:death-on-curing protein